MKKMMTVLAACAVTSLALADSGVVSANVVGYSTLNILTNTYTAIGWQFALVGGDTQLPIASITNYPNATKGNGLSVADSIRRYDSVGKTFLEYYHRSTGWRKTGESVTTTDALQPGEMTLFFKRGAVNSQITQAGEVINQNMTILLPTNTYTALCNPFPVAISIASFTNYPNATIGNGLSVADSIRRYDSVGKTFLEYYYRSTGWRKTGESVTTTDQIQVGEGVLFFKRGSVNSSITFDTPLN